MTNQPRRIKVTGDLFHGQVPTGAIYVGRAAPGLPQSPYANPHGIGKPCRQCRGRTHNHADAVDQYRLHLYTHPDLIQQARRELAGHDLACWCNETDPCHGAVLLHVANGGNP